MDAASGSSDRLSPAGRPDWTNRLERWCPLLLLPLMLADAAAQARAKAFWFDELISYSLARLPSLGALWSALAEGADAQPPLSHLLMRLSMALFGTGELAARLPNLLGFAVMSVALYVAIRRRQGGLYAVCGVLFAWVTLGYEYAYEARPYGLMLGFGACSYLFWQFASEQCRPRWAVPALLASLALCVSSHYYAGLILLPLGLGELVRSKASRKLDWPVWATFAVAASVLAAHAPLLLAIRANFQGGFWRKVEWDEAVVFYLNLLESAAVPVVLAFAAAALVKRRTSAAAADRSSGLGGLPRHEAAAALALAALPIAYVGLSIYTTGGFTSRYALVSLVGVVLVFVMTLRDATQHHRPAVAAAALTLACSFLWVRVAHTAATFSEPTEIEVLREIELPRITKAIDADSGVLAVASPLKFFQYVHYASPELAARLVYPVDTAAARKHTPGDNCDVTLLSVARWTGVRTPAFEEFRRSHQAFYLTVWEPAPFDWLSAVLEERNAVLETLDRWDEISVARCCAAAAAEPNRLSVLQQAERGGPRQAGATAPRASRQAASRSARQAPGQ